MGSNNYTQSLQSSRGIYMTYAALTAVAWLSCFEVFVKTFFVFNRWKGLYFWSIHATVVGIMVNTVGLMLHFYTGINQILAATLVTVGWWGMVTGQSLVLYSRLHLVVRSKKLLRILLTMIIFNAIFFHIPTSVLTLGAYATTEGHFGDAYSIVEKIQCSVFCLQEVILSCTYIHQVRKLLRKSTDMFRQEKAKRVLRHLIYINIFVIILDFAYVACEYANLYYMQAGLKSAVYAYQLHLEFTILNQLMSIVGGNTSTGRISNMPTKQRGQTDPHSGSDDLTHNDMSTSRTYAISTGRTGHEMEKTAFDDADGITMTKDVDVFSVGQHNPMSPPQHAMPAPAAAPMTRVEVPHAITTAGIRPARPDDDSSKSDEYLC